MLRLLSFIIMFGLCTSLNAQNYFGEKEEIDRILDNIKSFSEHVVASDYKKIAESYTLDGKMMPGGKDIIEGHADIEKGWTLPEGIRISAHKIDPEEIRIIEDYAYDYGYYSGKTSNADGSESSWKGKYVIVWKKVEGDWKIYLDIWNRVN